MKIIVQTPLTDLDYSFLFMIITDHQNNKLVPGTVPDTSATVEQTVSEKLTAQLSTVESGAIIDDGELDGPMVNAAPVADPVNVELDNNGIPWDARIHSTSKAKTADGNWRKVRNLDPSVYDLVMCELELGRDVIAPPPPAADIAPPPPAAAAVNAPTFPEFIGKIGAAMSAGKLTTEIINAAIVAVGFTTVADIAKNPGLIPLVLSTLQAQGHGI